MRTPSLILLMAGVVLFTWGVIASDSIRSTFSRAFSDLPSDKALWLLFVGVILIALGAIGGFRRSKD